MIYLDQAWDHQDLHRLYTVLTRSLLGKKPGRVIEPMLQALKSYGRNIQACLEIARAGRPDADLERLVQQSHDAVTEMAVDVIGDPYIAYVGAHSHNPGKSAFSVLIRRGGREQQVTRTFEHHTVESVTDAAVEYVQNMLAPKIAAFGVFVITPCTHDTVLSMAWNEDGHRFFRRVSHEAYRIVYDRRPE